MVGLDNKQKSGDTSMSLWNNSNHQIYWYFLIRKSMVSLKCKRFQSSNLPVLFSGTFYNQNHNFYGSTFLSEKSIGKFDGYFFLHFRLTIDLTIKKYQ